MQSSLLSLPSPPSLVRPLPRRCTRTFFRRPRQNHPDGEDLSLPTSSRHVVQLDWRGLPANFVLLRSQPQPNILQRSSSTAWPRTTSCCRPSPRCCNIPCCRRK